MSASAIIMMCIACIGLCGCGVSLYIMMKAKNGKTGTGIK